MGRPVCRLLRVLVVGVGVGGQQRSGIAWMRVRASRIGAAHGQDSGSRRRRRRPVWMRRPGMVNTVRRSVAAVARVSSGPANRATALAVGLPNTLQHWWSSLNRRRSGRWGAAHRDHRASAALV